MKSEIKTALILGIIIAIGVGILGTVFTSLDETKSTSTLTEMNAFLKMDKSGFKIAPDLVGIAHHLNTTPEELSEKIKVNCR